jgi:hypothetical protein
MNLPQYIEQLGDKAAAKLFETEIRTVQSWRRRERIPRKAKADFIVKHSPLTYEDIYSVERKTEE